MTKKMGFVAAMLMAATMAFGCSKKAEPAEPTNPCAANPCAANPCAPANPCNPQ